MLRFSSSLFSGHWLSTFLPHFPNAPFTLTHVSTARRRVRYGPAPFRWTVCNLSFRLFCPRLTYSTGAVCRRRRQSSVAGFFLSFAPQRPRVKLQERRSRSTLGVRIPRFPMIER